LSRILIFWVAIYEPFVASPALRGSRSLAPSRGPGAAVHRTSL